jgi:hypothetical protein
VSQVFDSLRRDATVSPRRHVPRLAQGDAVLATFGYPRVNRRSSASAVVALALMLGIVGIGWAGWTLYKRSMPARPASGVRPAATAAPRPPATSIRRQGASPASDQLDVAARTLLKALMTAPRGAAPHYNLGQLYDQTNEPARAIERYRTFLETAGAEHAARAAAVRARIAALSRTPE